MIFYFVLFFGTTNAGRIPFSRTSPNVTVTQRLIVAAVFDVDRVLEETVTRHSSFWTSRPRRSHWCVTDSLSVTITYREIFLSARRRPASERQRLILFPLFATYCCSLEREFFDDSRPESHPLGGIRVDSFDSNPWSGVVRAATRLRLVDTPTTIQVTRTLS